MQHLIASTASTGFTCVALLLLQGFSMPLPSQAGTGAEEAIRAVLAVGPEGQGNAKASHAWKTLAALPPESLPELLTAMDEASPLAINWLRSAVEAVADRSRQKGQTLPLLAIGDFLLDTRHHPRARRLAFELIERETPAAARRLVPGMLNDPAVELRREAVDVLLTEADRMRDAGEGQASTLLQKQAIGFARDIDQIRRCADALEAAGQTVDLPRLFGFLMDWHVMGPFSNVGREGFEKVFPPETTVNLEAECEGKTGPVRWSPFKTADAYGKVDINRALTDLKEVTAYAYAEFESPVTRPAELRMGCKNAWKIWFNDRFLFGQEEYHRGAAIDQYRMPVQLRAGKNTILVKVCQNEEIEEWTREWEFQIRMCDAMGTAIHSAKQP